MTSQEFIDLAKTCKDRKELLQKLGNYDDVQGNRKKYIQPLREAAGLTVDELTALFIKIPSPTASENLSTNSVNLSFPTPTPTVKKLEVIRRTE